jgi:hypothetical protein
MLGALVLSGSMAVAAAIEIPNPIDLFKNLFDSAQFKAAVLVLGEINLVLDKINGSAGKIQDRLAYVFPDNVVNALLGGHISPSESLQRVVNAMRCPWQFSTRTRGLQGIYRGVRICKDEWERFLGKPTGLAGADFEQFWDWESVNRMNLISGHIAAGDKHQKTAEWLMKSAVIGADADAIIRANGGSPGFAERVSAMASAHQGAIAAETGDVLIAMLQLDQQRLMRRQKEKRDQAMVAYAIYDSLGRSDARIIVPGDLR